MMNYWTERYLNNETGWDVGHVSTPIKEYVDQLTDKNLHILIPGCGNGYEAEYLHRQGFENVTVCDISHVPFDNLSDRCPTFPNKDMVLGNFFDLTGSYDLIIEQTFFCALNPSMRKQYAAKVHELLKPEGKLVGVLFNTDFAHDGPPFGGSRKEYIQIFSPYFNLDIIEDAHNSIKPRQGNELFIKFTKSA